MTRKVCYYAGDRKRHIERKIRVYINEAMTLNW